MDNNGHHTNQDNRFGSPITQVLGLDAYRSVHMQQIDYRDQYQVTVIDTRITVMIQKTVTLLDYIKLLEFLRNDPSPTAMLKANENF